MLASTCMHNVRGNPKTLRGSDRICHHNNYEVQIDTVESLSARCMHAPRMYDITRAHACKHVLYQQLTRLISHKLSKPQARPAPPPYLHSRAVNIVVISLVLFFQLQLKNWVTVTEDAYAKPVTTVYGSKC